MDVAIRLGIDAKKSDQGVRGSVAAAARHRQDRRVAVFVPAGEKAEAAKAAGADVVGMDDLAERMQAGDLDFGRVIATPDAMRVVGKLGQLLGPRGLMPNPKDGSVTADVVTAVKNAKAGQVKFRNDKAGIVHCTIGKANFDVPARGQPARAGQRPAEGEAGDREGSFPAEDCRCRARWVWRARRYLVADAVDQVRIKSRAGDELARAVFEGSPGCETGAAVKDRRRDQRATTTSRELAMAGKRRRRKRGRLIGFGNESGLRRWCCPFWDRLN